VKNSVRRLLCSKPPQKFVQTSFAQKLQFTGHIFSPWQSRPTFIQSRTVSCESRNIPVRQACRPISVLR